MAEWHDHVAIKREEDLEDIIKEEQLNPKETRKFLENSFRDGEIKTTGTDMDKLLPPISRFGGNRRAEKKQSVITKLKMFFEKYFGIGGPASFAEEPKPFTDTSSQPDFTPEEGLEPYDTKQ